MKTMKYATVATLAVMLAFTASASVTSAYYGDYHGTTVDFLSVQEHTTSPGDTVPKYGAPFVLGDIMDFTPIGFIAQSSGGVPDTTDGQLAFWVEAHDGMGIEKIGFAERGDFVVSGVGTDDTYVDVSATFYVDIYEVNDTLLSAPIQITQTMDFDMNTTTRDDGTHYLVSDGIVVEDHGYWSGNLSIDLSSILQGIDGFDQYSEATLISVSLDNVLTAHSQDGSNATIAKKDFNSHGMSVEIVPEPASIGLLLGASTLIVYARRRFIA